MSFAHRCISFAANAFNLAALHLLQCSERFLSLAQAFCFEDTSIYAARLNGGSTSKLIAELEEGPAQNRGQTAARILLKFFTRRLRNGVST